MAADLSFGSQFMSLPAWPLLAVVLFLILLLTVFIFWRRRSGTQSRLFQQNVLVSALLDINESAVLVDERAECPW